MKENICGSFILLLSRHPFLLNIFLLGCSFLFIPRFSTNDDPILAYLIYSGSHHLALCMHPLMSWILHTVSLASPELPVLFLMETLINFVSIYLLLKSVIHHLSAKTPPILFIFTIFTISFYALYNYIQPQFTQCAGLAMASAICFYTVSQTWKNRLFCTLWFLAGCTVRLDMIYAIIPFTGFLALQEWIRLIQHKKNRASHHSFSWSLFLVITLAAIPLLSMGEKLAYNLSPGWENGLHFNHQRALICDYPDYSGMDKSLEISAQTGLSTVEWNMLKNFEYVPQLAQQTNMIDQLASIHREGNTMETKMIHAKDHFPAVGNAIPLLFPIIGLLLTGMICIRRVNYSFWSYPCIAFSLIILFLFMGRVYNRVLYAPLLLCFVLMAISLNNNIQWKKIPGKVCIFLSMLIMAGLFLNSQGKILGGVIKRTFTKEQRESKVVFDYLTMHPEKIFISFDAFSTFEEALAVSRRNFLRTDHVINCTGWHMWNPTFQEQLDRNSITDPYLALYQDHVRFIQKGVETPAILPYLEHHLGIKTKAILCDSLGSYGIYRIQKDTEFSLIKSN